MPIKITHQQNGPQASAKVLLQHMGWGKATREFLAAMDIQPELTDEKLIFVRKGVTVATSSLPFDASMLYNVINGLTAQDELLYVMQDAFLQITKSLLASQTESVMPILPKAIKAPLEVTAAEEPEPAPAASKPVPLAEADQLYQPVLGTSVGSKYVYVAGFQHLKVAARYKSHTLSFRVEGDNVTKYAEQLKKSDFSIKGTHASMHLSIPEGDVNLLRRVFGSVLGSLMFLPLETEYPVVQLAVGQ